ncbi:uncharacterized protein [Narcine bancroftii]|uniref:uncharacterized protein n=1 Tax=Narcine bancroftii TaxID=1343680 RepID=UPI00383182E5
MKGRVNQSRSLAPGKAYKVVDGFRHTKVHQNTCAQIRSTHDPWWKLDLKKTNVASVIKVNMKSDCCPESNLGAQIRIGNSLENNGNSNRLCATIRSVAETSVFACNGFVGRYVNIILPGHNRNLSLCEVEFFGTKLPSLKDAVNLAILGTATQSSTKNNAHAFRAIDRYKNLTARLHSCSRTKKSVNPWWRLDLYHTYIVAVVRITGRRDCCLDQLLGAEIRIGNTQENQEKDFATYRVAEEDCEMEGFSFWIPGLYSREDGTCSHGTVLI